MKASTAGGCAVVVWMMAFVACSSGGSDGGGTGGSAGGGQCPEECFTNTECVAKCGDTPVDVGCCACPTGMKDVRSCSSDAGTDAPSDASCVPQIENPGTVTCGAVSCGPTEVCVYLCCGGAAIDGEACKPPPPYCAPATEVSCCGGSTCNHGGACFGMLSGQTLSCQCA